MILLETKVKDSGRPAGVNNPGIIFRTTSPIARRVAKELPQLHPKVVTVKERHRRLLDESELASRRATTLERTSLSFTAKGAWLARIIALASGQQGPCESALYTAPSCAFRDVLFFHGPRVVTASL